MARLGLDDSEDSSEDDEEETDTAPTPTDDMTHAALSDDQLLHRHLNNRTSGSSTPDNVAKISNGWNCTG